MCAADCARLIGPSWLVVNQRVKHKAHIQNGRFCVDFEISMPYMVCHLQEPTWPFSIPFTVRTLLLAIDSKLRSPYIILLHKRTLNPLTLCRTFIDQIPYLNQFLLPIVDARALSAEATFFSNSIFRSFDANEINTTRCQMKTPRRVFVHNILINPILLEYAVRYVDHQPPHRES